MRFANPHAEIDAANYEKDRKIAGLIRLDPAVIAVARENLASWAEKWGGLSPAQQEWAKILRMLTPEQVAAFLESTTPKANRLRQSSPFKGVWSREVQRSTEGNAT